MSTAGETNMAGNDASGWRTAIELCDWLIGQDGAAAKRMVERRRLAAAARRSADRSARLRRLLVRKECTMLPAVVGAHEGGGVK